MVVASIDSTVSGEWLPERHSATWEQARAERPMTDITTTTGGDSPSSGFDVRLVGQRSTLSVLVRRIGDRLDGDISCDLTISQVVGRDTHACPVSFHVVAPDHAGISQQAIDIVEGEGHRIRNLTRFRYDMESTAHDIYASHLFSHQLYTIQ